LPEALPEAEVLDQLEMDNLLYHLMVLQGRSQGRSQVQKDMKLAVAMVELLMVPIHTTVIELEQKLKESVEVASHSASMLVLRYSDWLALIRQRFPTRFRSQCLIHMMMLQTRQTTPTVLSLALAPALAPAPAPAPQDVMWYTTMVLNS